MTVKVNVFLKYAAVILSSSVLGCDSAEYKSVSSAAEEKTSSPTDVCYEIREATCNGDVDKYLTLVNDDLEFYKEMKMMVRDPSIKKNTSKEMKKDAENLQLIVSKEVVNGRKAYLIVNVKRLDINRRRNQLWLFTKKHNTWKFTVAGDATEENMIKVEDWMTNDEITPFGRK